MFWIKVMGHFPEFSLGNGDILLSEIGDCVRKSVSSGYPILDGKTENITKCVLFCFKDLVTSLLATVTFIHKKDMIYTVRLNAHNLFEHKKHH